MRIMADRDTLQILKYFVGIIMAVLLTHECVVETLVFSQTSTDLQFRYTDEQLHQIRPRRAVFDFRMSMTIEAIFDTRLNDPNDTMYKIYASTIQSAIEDSYKTLPAYIKGSVRVERFRLGSIIVDYTIYATVVSPNSPAIAAANIQVARSLRSLGIPVALHAFAESVQTNLSAEKLYPQQDMVLKCIWPEFVEGTMTWSVPKSVANTRYSVSDNGSTLTVKNINKRDRGRYACIINRILPYSQWQDIVIEPLPNIIVDNNVKVFECADQTIQLTCCEKIYEVEWRPIPSGDQVKASDKGCITVFHKIMSIDCEAEIFTCQLKNPALQHFHYSRKSVIVHKVIGEVTCKSEMLGDGIRGDIRTGLCDKGWEGSITCQCISGMWEVIYMDCVLQVIKDLEKKAEVLVVIDMPVLVAELSNATVQNTQEITQSPETIQTIVGILVTIADISQNVIINKPVMENFLKTVDIIVSDETINSWDQLNNGTTGDTGVALLHAIENIGDRLTDGEFTIKETSIKLTRTTIISSYSGISTLPNSTTEILIPQVLEPTAMTIIIFSRLDKVLPTRTTSNGNSKTSVSRISGDVVVVKVNQTLKNILFTFDIIDKHFGNPECVFWDFNLNAWHSTGCEVKSFRIETGKITCECHHTTSFSILMSPFLSSYALAYITYIGVAISMASLILCLIIEIIVWKSVTRNKISYMRHVSIVNIAVSLLIANICFITGALIAEQEQPTSVSRCSPAVFFMHLFYLSLFFWMLISALLLFYHTVTLFSQMSRAKITAITFSVGYGAPLLIAIITVASTAGPQHYITRIYVCWLNWNESKALLAFVVPALTIVAINLVLLIVALYKMLKTGAGAATQPNETHALVVIIRCVAFLTPLFALTWGFGLGTMVSRDFGVHVVFTLLNSLQGFFILVFGTLSDSKIREALAGKLRMWRSNLYDQLELRTFSAASSSNNSTCSDTFLNA